MLKSKFFFSIITFFIVGGQIAETLAASDKFYPNKLNSCQLTKSATNNYEPEKFQPTNNLLRATGKQPIYCGQKIIVSGRILDQKCVPVSDAKVYLWQVGCDGKYPYRPLRNRIDKKMLNLAAASTFTGCGIATTNNNGEFHFITIYPPAAKQGNPYVNIRVEHRRLGELQTKFYLSNDRLVDGDKELSPALASAIDEVKIYNMDIVIKGDSLKRY